MLLVFNDTDPAVKEFKGRVDRYVDLLKDVEGALSSLDKKEEDPAKIVNHQKQLAAGIRAARPKAERGDIFTPRVQRLLLRIIKQELASGEGKTVRAMILGEGNPKNPESAVKVDLSVNAVYPDKAPLSTVPPSVLLKLPALPEAVEYRFVGRHLILHDRKANLIVDVLPNAVR